MSTERALHRAPIDVLKKSLTVYDWIGNVTFVTFPTCLLLGLWVDWRWFPTALLPFTLWCLAHAVSDRIEGELERRRAGAAVDCPDLVEGD